MKPSVIVWDLETVPDLGEFAAANDLVGKPDADVRAALGNKFPKQSIGLALSTAGTRGARMRCLDGPLAPRIRGLPEAPSRVALVAGFFSGRGALMSVQSRHWLDYDTVALVVLVVGMSAVALLALSI